MMYIIISFKSIFKALKLFVVHFLENLYNLYKYMLPQVYGISELNLVAEWPVKIMKL